MSAGFGRIGWDHRGLCAGHAYCGAAIDVLLGGPPCETWSIARTLDDGPAVVRTVDSPWIKKNVSTKYVQQVELGNELLLAYLVMFLEL